MCHIHRQHLQRTCWQPLRIPLSSHARESIDQRTHIRIEQISRNLFRILANIPLSRQLDMILFFQAYKFLYEGERYHHLLDPTTGRPARRSRSATVIAPTTEQADALSTALFTAGKEAGLVLIDSLPDVEGMVVDQNGKEYPSRQYAQISTRSR